MRLGVVGMLPADFRQINAEHLAAIRALGLTGAAFHTSGEMLFDVSDAECVQVRAVIAAADMDLPQFGIGYSECLFDPDQAVRDTVLRTIGRGIEVAAALGAGTCLLRTGSLSPSGSYSPCRDNHSPQSWERLIATLRSVCDKAEAEGVTIVLETHALTIADSPETNVRIVEGVGSDRMRIVMDYVNHFQTLAQVFSSTERINHIYDVMSPVCPVGHCKDIKLTDGLVLHIDEEIIGEGELDVATALRRWHEADPEGYMLLEHLPNEKYPQASANVHRILSQAGIEVH
jgi:sugar phosphate isomerase/epimerase